MNAVAEVLPDALPESLGTAKAAQAPLDRLQLLGAAARLFAQVPTLAKAGTELAGELARVTLGRSRCPGQTPRLAVQGPDLDG